MKILITGAGSVGLGLASFLIKSGAEVHILAREKAVEELAIHGLVRTGIFGNNTAHPDQFRVISALNDLDQKNFDYILVAVKSFDSGGIACRLKDSGAAEGNGPIVLCQNGYGNRETFITYFPQERIFQARIITGFRRTALNAVDITVHAAPVRIGHVIAKLSKSVLNLSDALNSSGLPSEISLTIDKDIWSKILYNVLLNPLGAIFKVPYGELGKSAYSRAIMEQLAHETFAVMRAAGFSTYWETAEAFLEAFYSAMLPPTEAHESSMLQDIRSGARTEIDALNGAVVALARKDSIPVPVNGLMCTMIRFLESRSGNR